MKRLFYAVVCMLMALGTRAQKTINDPNAEVRAASNFHAISISNAFNVYLTQGNEEAVAVSAAELKYRDLIMVEVKGGVLFIGLRKDGWNWIKGDKKLKAYISFKNIDKLDLSGNTDAYIQGLIKVENLRMDLSGSSNVKGKLEAKKLVVDLSGASDMTVNGSVGQLTISASGASKFKGADLSTDFCDAHATGSSDIMVTVNKELSAQASGNSDVQYKGEGVIRDIKTSGSSSISRIKS
jgi:hypothetical protein